MSRLGTAIILAFSRSPGSSDLKSEGNDWSEDPLSLLRRAFPSFEKWIHGKRILDVGCGFGFQSVEFWRRGANTVVGLDTNVAAVIRANAMAVENGAAPMVSFTDALPPDAAETFDVVVSQNAMEHFPDPSAVLKAMISAVKPGGDLLITFGPPWYSPYGGHMHFFTKLPWLTVLFSEDSVMRARARFRSDGATRYVDVESGLNRMSVRKFERLLDSHGLRVGFVRYECVKGADFLARIPILRELFINQVTVTAKVA
jgi:SAM-dependent methyltransferase